METETVMERKKQESQFNLKFNLNLNHNG